MSPAAPVATPTITEAFEPLALEPAFELELELERGFELDFEPEAPARERDDELRLREVADDDLRLDALLVLALFALPPDLLPPEALPLFDEADRLLPELRVEALGFDPLELREDLFCLLDEPVLVWAITPPWDSCPAFAWDTPIETRKT